MSGNVFISGHSLQLFLVTCSLTTPPPHTQKATLPLHGIPRSIEDDNGEEGRMERGERRRSLGRIFTGPKRRQLPEHCEISGPFLDIPSFLPLAPARAWKWGKEGHSGMAIGGQGGEEGGRPKK